MIFRADGWRPWRLLFHFGGVFLSLWLWDYRPSRPVADGHGGHAVGKALSNDLVWLLMAAPPLGWVRCFTCPALHHGFVMDLPIGHRLYHAGHGRCFRVAER